MTAEVPPYGVYGQQIEKRAATRIGYWRRDVNAGIGEVVLTYGRPVWKSEYQSQLDELTEGRLWRMGDNYWSLLDTQLKIKIGGVSIEPGLYYLAIGRSVDGEKWELVFIDPVQSREKLLDSYDVGTRPDEIPILFKAPLKFEANAPITKELTLLFTLRQGSTTEGELRLSWGPFALVAPVEVALLPEPAG